MEFEFAQNTNPQLNLQLLDPQTYAWEICEELRQCQEEITRRHEEWQLYQGTVMASELEAQVQAMIPMFDILERKFRDRFNSYFAALNNQIQNAFLKTQHWRQEQEKLYQGKLLLANVTSSLNDMGVHFEFCTNRLWCLHELLKKTMSLHLDFPPFLIPSTNTYTGQIRHLQYGVVQCLQRIVANSLIVTTQPSQVTRVATLTKPTVKHLVGSQLRSTYPIQVFCYLLDEIQALELCSPESLPQEPPETCCRIARNESVLDANYSASWRNAMLSNNIERLNEHQVPGIRRVADENNWFYYHCEWAYDGIEFKASAFSFPVKIATHPALQMMEMLETALWDVASGKLGVSSVTDRGSVSAVSWMEFACALSALFDRMTGRGLTEKNMLAIAAKMWSPQFAELVRQYPMTCITSEQFRAINDGLGFSPAKWIFSMLKLITEFLSGERQGQIEMPGMWADGAVWGFVTDQNVDETLKEKPDGTFFIRFSNSTPGALTVDCVANSGQIESSRETSEQLRLHPILRRIALVSEWQCLLTCANELVPRNIVLAKYAPPGYLTPPGIRPGYVRPLG